MRAKRRRWRKRQDWLKHHLHLLGRIVFIDETGLNTKMARLRGRSAKGQRLIASIPHGHWKTMTFIAGLRHDGMTAPWVLDGPMDGPAFITFPPPPDPAVVTESWPGTADCHESPLSAVRLDHQIVLNQWLTFAMPDPHPFQGFEDQAAKRLAILNAAPALDTLRALPSNRLEALRGDRAGQYSIPCLSGCHPHPLYVGCGVEWLGRRTKRGWMFRSAKTFRFRGRFPSFNDFSRMTRPVPPTWRRRGGVTGSSAPIARRRQSRSASPAGPASCAVESAAATPG